MSAVKSDVCWLTKKGNTQQMSNKDSLYEILEYMSGFLLTPIGYSLFHVLVEWNVGKYLLYKKAGLSSWVHSDQIIPLITFGYEVGSNINQFVVIILWAPIGLHIHWFNPSYAVKKSEMTGLDMALRLKKNEVGAFHSEAIKVYSKLRRTVVKSL